MGWVEAGGGSGGGRAEATTSYYDVLTLARIKRLPYKYGNPIVG